MQDNTAETRTPTLEERRLRYWIRRAETRPYTLAIWALIATLIFLPESIKWATYPLFALIVVLHLLEWRQGKKVTEKVAPVLEKLAGDQGVLAEVTKHFSEMPGRDRTLEKLTALTSGNGLATDGLNCYERGRHVLGCPHRQLNIT